MRRNFKFKLKINQQHQQFSGQKKSFNQTKNIWQLKVLTFGWCFNQNRINTLIRPNQRRRRRHGLGSNCGRLIELILIYNGLYVFLYLQQEAVHGHSS